MSNTTLFLPAYVRRFSQRSAKKEKTEVSKWFPRPLRNALKYGLGSNGFMRDSDYVLGPLYTAGELQFGVTGGVAEEESYNMGVARELGEEIGLVPRHLDELQKAGYGRYNDKVMHTYNLYINHCVPVLDSQHGAILTNKQDSYNRKVGCLVYGTKEQILSYLNSSKIYIYFSHDKLQGVGAFRVKDILPYIK